MLCIDGELKKKKKNIENDDGRRARGEGGNKWGNFGEESCSPENRSLGSSGEPIIGV